MDKDRINALLAAVRDGGPWLERFTRPRYAGAFQDYTAQYGALWRTALRETEDPARLAEDLIDAMEAGWKEERFWNRSVRRFEEKRMLLTYLSPMLLELGEEPFAACLRDAWNRRRPQDTYTYVSFAELNGGFRNAILGFDLGSR